MSTSERTEAKNLNIVDLLYKLRGDYLVIGLTGKTGAGCSTAASVFEKPQDEITRTLQSCCEYRAQNAISDNEKTRANGGQPSAFWQYREAQIVKNYIAAKWEAFKILKMSDVILFYLLLIEENMLESILQYEELPGGAKEEWKKYEPLRKKAKEYYGLFQSSFKIEQDYDIEGFFRDIHDFRSAFLLGKCKLSECKLRELMREWANDIRQYGCISPPLKYIDKAIGGEEEQEIQSAQSAHKLCKDTPAVLAWTANQFIKLIHRQAKSANKTTRVVIDGIKNPYEVLFFRERYSSFFLSAIHMDEYTRTSRLQKQGYSDETLSELDGPDKITDEKLENKGTELERGFVQVSANTCIEMADIHLENKIDQPYYLVEQIGRYVALMLHPGLLQPTAHERIMQIAYTAKMNAGCLSRQVGAVVTDKHYSVKAIGWNSVPDGQMPCTMRCMHAMKNDDRLDDYSMFEKSDKFMQDVDMLLELYKYSPECASGLPLYFCFKDIYTSATDKQEGNQVHTRSLHAEENAFLQLAKYGSMGIEGGYLFTTDQCCVLCAKKAYQLGIRTIYYVSSYKDISESHILGCGCKDVQKAPIMKRFYGVVGGAYSKLFTTFISHKDEITYISKIDVKKTLREIKNKTSLSDNGEAKSSINA